MRTRRPYIPQLHEPAVVQQQTPAFKLPRSGVDHPDSRRPDIEKGGLVRPTPQAPRQPAQGNPAAMCENEEQKTGTAVCKNEAMENGGDVTRRVIKQPVNGKRNNKEEREQKEREHSLIKN